MSAALTAILAYYTSALQWVQQPYVYSCARIFLFLLWTCIGISILRNQRRILPVRLDDTSTVRIAHDYAYSLVVENFHLQPLKITDKIENGLQITCYLRNVGVGPLELITESVDLVIDGKTSKELDLTAPIKTIFARQALKGISAAPVEIDGNKNTLSGYAIFKVLYGEPCKNPERRFTLKIKIHIALDQATKAYHMIVEGAEEKDEPYDNIKTSS